MPAEGDPANDAMAQTLNYALGNLGGRQKSWMHVPNPDSNPSPSHLTATSALPFTVRKRGRPPKKAAAQSTAAPAHAAIKPLAERQPPSNSTSPQLANVVTHRDDQDRRPPSVTVFPSPTPSEETTDNAAMPALRGRDGTANADSLALTAAHSIYAPDTPLETVFMDAVQRAGSRPKRPSEHAANQAANRNHPREHVQPSATVPRPQRPEFPRQPSVPQPHTASPQLAQGMHALPAARTPPVAQAPFGPARTLSRGAASQPLSVNLEMNPTMPNQNATPTSPHPMTQPDWYTAEECLRVLKSFQATFVVSEDRQRDATRLDVLLDATKTEDWQYLIMHQFYCLLDYNPSSLPAELLNNPELNQALRVMQNVLDSNKHLSPVVLHFFSSYPYPLEKLFARWRSTLERQTRIFLSFIAHSPNYDKLSINCLTRRFPPVAWELAHYLSLSSMTFQRLLFISLLRRIWNVPRNPLQLQYEAQAVRLFKQDQAGYYTRITRTTDGRFPTVQQLQQDNEVDLRHWGYLLKQLVEKFEATLCQQGYAVSTPYDAVSPHVQQSPIPIQQYPQPISADMSYRAYPSQPYSAQAAIQQTRGLGRPRIQPVAPTHIVPSTPQAQQTRAPIRLLPAPGNVLSQQRLPNPARFSLHQANLRSPLLLARSLESPLYCYVQGYIKSPARMAIANQAVERWSFTLDAEMATHIAAAIPGARGQVDRRLVDPRSKIVRLRCIRWPAAQPPNEHVWAVTDTAWVPYSYFTFNGTSLQQRKKIHHGKDLPIDITGLLKQGENVLEMTVMTHKEDTAYQNYLVAIEILGFISRTTVIQRCLTESRISAAQVIENIKRKLGGDAEDDEVAIVGSNLTINLFDPFSASKMCDIPVRSRACLHNDCFDLETFLDTRRQKGDVCVPDGWRCPICNADARPSHLLVDEFLQEVKTQLDGRNLSKTRAITVQQNGSWDPKPEVRDPNGVSDRGLSNESPTPSTARASLPAQVEVIDLSD